IMVIILGFVSFTSMTTDLFPKMELPYVVVVTTYPGANPEKVELAVTKPIEQSLATTSGVKNITSVSQENMSMVILEFENGVNMDSAMIEMNGSLDLIKGRLDDMVSSPILMKMNPDMLPLMVASVDMDGVDTASLSSFAQESVIPELERLDGVASVSATGLLQQRFDITLNQQKIDKLNDLLTASVDENLGSAQQKLREARTQLENGKNELKTQQDSAQKQLVDGSVQLSSATATLNALLSEETTLNAQKQAFEAEKSAYAQAESGYQAANAALAAAKAAAQQQVEQAKAQIVAAVNEQLAALGGTVPGLPPSISTYEDAAALAGTLGLTLPPLPDVSSVPGSVEDALAMPPEAFEAFKAMGGEQLAGVTQESLLQLKNAVATASTRLPEIETELRNMEMRLTTIAAMKPQLQSALEQANSGYAQLEGGKLTFSSSMAAAQSQLSLAEQKLDDAQAEFETQRDDALKQADIGGILTTDMLKNLLAAQNFSMPAGSLAEGADSYTVKVGDVIKSREELENLPLLSIDADGLRDIRLRDVADIALVDNADENYAKINGNDGLILSFNKQSTSSTAEVSQSIRAAAERLQAAYPGLHITPLMDQGVYIDIVISSVLQNLLMGAVLAILILLLFLRDWKPTLIIGVSIPISVMFAVVLMYFSGVTLNIVSLSGLALGIGMLVDNSIVVIENTYRLRALGMSAAKAAVKGAAQVAGAICASTLTTICVFLPIVFTEGITRQLFTDMGLTIAFSLVASLIVALTLVPAMSQGMMGKTAEKQHRLFDKIVHVYEKGLDWSLRHKAVVLLTALALFAASIVSIAFMGTSFIPETDGT
ncbi:MAG: efflux RND transporter permease subunit, partial [Oscillospiraceae bacterium]|nr:efflux RND transporter permease subunit [Oscillospiraceae bacterium]